MSTFICFALIYAVIGAVTTATIRAIWKEEIYLSEDEELESVLIGLFWVFAIPLAICYVILAHFTEWAERKIAALIKRYGT